jgi:hypothetical protein
MSMGVFGYGSYRIAFGKCGIDADDLNIEKRKEDERL